jgi:hypothetical protein
VELVRIERGGGEATQSPEGCEREDDASEQGGKRPVRPTEPLVGFD